MGSSFSSLHIGYSGLAAQQRALDLTGHNVANANTEGYTRQDAVLRASPALKTPQGYVGTGVTVASIRRIRDEFLDIQMRTENRALGEWEVKANILGKLEVIVAEPSETGLRAVMDQFWESWQVLAKNPASIAARTTVVQRGIALTNTFNHLESQFCDLKADINKGIEVKVNEINSMARQIRDINEQIIKAEVVGHKANDLRDRRDLLLEQLSKNVAIDIVEDDFGAVNVMVGGRFLVSRAEIGVMRFTDDFTNPGNAVLDWCDPLTGKSQGPVLLQGGALKGYVEMRDEVIQSYEDQLSALAAQLAGKVNELHRAGYGLDGLGERDFFTPADGAVSFNIRNIQVDAALIANPDYLACALELVTEDAAGNPLATPYVYQGDGGKALAIAQLKNELTMSGEIATFDDFYRSLIGQLGIQGQEAFQTLENRVYLVEQLINRRDSVSGVSLDEEMTNMIRFQHAYTAAARVINVMDEMLELIVNRLGTVGR